jgi:hypothetical protein
MELERDDSGNFYIRDDGAGGNGAGADGAGGDEA